MCVCGGQITTGINVNQADTSLATVADCGYLVFKMVDKTLLLTASSGFSQIEAASQEIDEKDSLAVWAQAALGVSDLRKIGKSSEFVAGLAASGHAIGLAGFSNGQKVITLMFRLDNDLTQELTAEAFAASFALAGAPTGASKIEPTPKVAAYLSKVIEGSDDQEISQELDLSLRAVKERKKKTIDEFSAKTLTHAVALSVK